MPFGQVVVGAPGSGKTTWCLGVAQHLRALGRDVAIINLDPANNNLPFECDVDIMELVSLDEVQAQMGLGPNGGLVYCIDFLLANMDWLQPPDVLVIAQTLSNGTDRLVPILKRGAYFLFDCPGQAELHAVHNGFRAIVRALVDTCHLAVTAVHLVDSHLVTSAHKHLAALLATLGSMLHLELPYVTLLSKSDLLHAYNKGAHRASSTVAAATPDAQSTDDTCICHGGGDTTFLSRSDGSDIADAELDPRRLADLDVLATQLEASAPVFGSRFAGLTEGLLGVVQDYGLLTMTPVAIDDSGTIDTALELIDLANGFAYSGLGGRNPYATAEGALARDASSLDHKGGVETAAHVPMRVPCDIWSGRELHEGPA